MVRIGLIGSGRMARTRVDNIAAVPGASLVALTSRSEETAYALARDCGCAYVASAPDLLARSDIDAVIVATHNDAHGALAMSALHAGKHVLVEYPLALDPLQVDEIVTLAAQRKLVVQVGYDQLWRGADRALAEAIVRDGAPLDMSVTIAWAGGRRRTPFRHVYRGGSPAQVKSYYLYALLSWLGLPSAHNSCVRYAGLSDDGYYDAAVQHIALWYPHTLVYARWVVGPDVGSRRQIDIEAVWPAYALHGDGERLMRHDAMGERALDSEIVSWAEATRRGFQSFIAAVLDGQTAGDHLALAAAAARLAAAAPELDIPES